MKIVADENIPLIKHYFGEQGELLLKSGRDITRKDLIDADMLLVRSVTKVNQALLQNTSVKFVGSATSGADHVDTDWLDSQSITWSVAQGCNAAAVAEYVVCMVAALQKKNFLLQKNIRAAVVGVSRIGQRVADKFQALGFEVVLCDPLRSDIHSTAFAALSDLDLISFHTPLTRSGAYPTFRMVQKTFLQKQKKNCILLNAGRGEVFDFSELKEYGGHLNFCLDVWEHEPHIDADMLRQVLIATPHIAGYSLQSKYRGIEMIYRAAVDAGFLKNQAVLKVDYPVKKLSVAAASTWRDIVLEIFNPDDVSLEMKNNPKEFDELRKTCANRYEFGFVDLQDVNLSDADVLLLKNIFLS